MWKTLLTLAPALVVIVFITSHHSSLFGTAPHQRVAQLLVSGRTYYGDINYDERAFNSVMARQLPRNITTLVAGSSRTMQLDSSCFIDPMYNASVSGAMISDIAATIEEFRQGRRLEHVIIAADPWMLNAHEQAAAWNNSPVVPNLMRTQAAPGWLRAQRRLGLTPHAADYVAAARAFADPLRELFDPETFHAALWPASFAVASFSTFRKDPNGSVTYPSGLRATEASALQDASAHLAATYSGFDRVDPFLAHAFEQLTRDLTAHGTRVTLVLAPFHPAYYQRVGNLLPMAEAFYRGLHLETVGSYQPRPGDVFLDGVHLRFDSLRALFGCAFSGVIE